MAVIEVTALADPRLSDYANLTDAALRTALEPQRGLYMAEGARVIGRALAAGHRPRSLLAERKRGQQALELLQQAGAGDDVPVYLADQALIRSVTGYRVHRGFLAAMHRPAPLRAAAVVSTATRVLVLEDLVDHTNVGAAFRSAAALGFDAVLVSPRCADPLYRRSIKVSMAAVLAVPWAVADPWPQSLEDLRAAGFLVAALTPRSDAVALGDLAGRTPAKVALLIGTEGAGLTAAAIERSDAAVKIPMFAGVDSLNAAAATAVACYALGPAAASTVGRRL
jgi:tRNA G18 (ribose-2'-O)-methylase SpoU